MEKPKFLDFHRFLAVEAIQNHVGGTGWMIDLALNADRYNPKTFLLKTRKCSENGSIVLEPALSPENYINPKSVSESTTKSTSSVSINESTKSTSSVSINESTKSTSSVSINESLSEESVRTIVSESSAVSQHKYAFVKSYDARGEVRFRIAPNAGFGASMSGSKSTSSSVEVSCKDLVTKSVDFEDLRSALDEHTVNTSATNIEDEDSLFVITDVLVAGKISWEVKQNVESKKSGGGNVDVEPVNVAAEGGTSSQRPQEQKQEVNNAVLALKLAKISYNSKAKGKIVELRKSGSFEGNYTLGSGTAERKEQTAIMVLGRAENGRRGSELIIRSIGHCQTSRCAHTDEIPLQDVVEKGKHQRKLHGSWHLPLKGLVVTKKHSYRISWTRKRKETIYLEKVTVTDVQADNTFTCICNSQLDIPKDDWIWVDCEQWIRRDSMIKNEVRVNVEFEGSVRTLTVDEEDPIFVIMHKMRDKVPCYKQVLKYKGEVISNPAETITNLGIQDGDRLTLEEDGSNLTNVLELTTANSRSSKGRISNKQSRSLPSALSKCICKKYPGLNLDEATVEQILQKELSEDDDMSPEGFQRLMEAVGKMKVELDDIRRAIVLHEDGFDEDDKFNVLHMMDLSLEGKSWFNVGDAVMSASNVDRDASFRSLPKRKAEEDSSGDVGKKTRIRMVSSTALAVEEVGLFKKEQEEQQQQKAFMTD